MMNKARPAAGEANESNDDCVEAPIKGPGETTIYRLQELSNIIHPPVDQARQAPRRDREPDRQTANVEREVEVASHGVVGNDRGHRSENSIVIAVDGENDAKTQEPEYGRAYPEGKCPLMWLLGCRQRSPHE